MKLIAFAALLFYSYQLRAQVGFTTTNAGGLVTIADINGISLANKSYDASIEGSPFYYNEWVPADIQLKSGKWIKGVKCKLNAESNQVYFLDSMAKEMIAPTGLIIALELGLPVESEQGSYRFESGYPPTEGASKDFLYQVLEEGKVELLQKITKPIETFKNELSGEIRKEFVEHRIMYMYADGLLKMLKYDKAFVLDMMKDKRTEIETYLAANKINFKKIADIRKLVKHYNRL